MVRAFMRRVVALLTIVAVGLLVWISIDIARTAPDIDTSTSSGLWFLMGLAWLAAFGISVWFVPPAWSGTCLLAMSGALAVLAGVVRDSVPARSSALYEVTPSELAMELRFAIGCAFILLVVWAAWSSLPGVRIRSAKWATIAVGVGAAALLVTAWLLVPDLPSYVD